VACDSKSTFASVIYDIVNEACNKHPFVAKKLKETRVGISTFILNADYKETAQDNTSPNPPSSVNEAVRYIQAICDVNHFRPVIVIDEFDQLKDRDEQTYFTNFIKQVSDKHVSAKFVFCGIGDSVETIMSAHESADRYFHTVALGQLPWEARVRLRESKGEIEAQHLADGARLRQVCEQLLRAEGRLGPRKIGALQARREVRDKREPGVRVVWKPRHAVSRKAIDQTC
jgi:uncharacterized protein